jgi:hypothetical protein
VCLAAGDYDCAAQSLKALQETVPNADESLRFQYWRLKAELALTLGNGESETALRELLSLRPDWAPDPKTWPPKWSEALELARRKLPDTEGPELAVKPPLMIHENQPLRLEAIASDKSGVGRVEVIISGREERRLRMVTSDNETWSAILPAEWVTAPRLALWVEAFDRRGNGPTFWGRKTAPKTFQVIEKAVIAPPEGPPLWKKWWFWTVIGAGLTATAVTTYLLTGTNDSEIDPIYSTLEVNLTWPQYD